MSLDGVNIAVLVPLETFNPSRDPRIPPVRSPALCHRDALAHLYEIVAVATRPLSVRKANHKELRHCANPTVPKTIAQMWPSY